MRFDRSRRPPPWWRWGGLLLLLLIRASAFRPSSPLHRPTAPPHRISFVPRPAAPSAPVVLTATTADTIGGLAARVRKAARAKPTGDREQGVAALRELTGRLATALLVPPPQRQQQQQQHSPKIIKKGNGSGGSGGGGGHRVETRRLVLAAVGDCARANADPGPEFWAALGRWIQPVATLPTEEIAALALALATLDVPPGSESLWGAMIAAVAHRAKGVGPREAGQLRKALTLLLGPGGAFRVGPQPMLAWLLPLLRAREARAHAGGGEGGGEDDGGMARPLSTRRREQGRVRRPAAAAASGADDGGSGAAAASSSGGSSSSSSSHTTYSALHRRLLDLLEGMGCAPAAEVAYQGLNLDIVLYPPTSPPRRPLLKPLVIEVDGPQHFLQGDPARPNGATAARHRLLRAATDAFAGLVSITYADESGLNGGSSSSSGGGGGGGGGGREDAGPRARLLALLEREAAAQAGVALAGYRIGCDEGGDGTDGEAQWAQCRRLLLAPTPEALVAEARGGRAVDRDMDVGAWAVAVGRVGAFLRHGHRFRGRGPTARAARRGWVVGESGVLRSEAQALELVAAAPFPALALMLPPLAAYYADGGKDAAAAALMLTERAVERVGELLLASSSSSSSPPEDATAAATTPAALVSILRALAALGYRSAAGLPPPLLPLLARMAQEDRFDAHGLAALVASLGQILRPPPYPDDDAHQQQHHAACLAALCAAAERRLVGANGNGSARRTDLLLLAQGLAALRRGGGGFTPPDAFVAALVGAAGRAAPSLPLVPALALLTLREPAGGDERDGGTDLMSQRERRRTPQWALVGEVRARLRALSPSGLVQALREVAGAGDNEKDDGDEQNDSTDAAYLPPPRAFLVMLCSELYKRRDQLSGRERARAVALLRGRRLGGVYDPGSRFWQRMISCVKFKTDDDLDQESK